MAGRKGQKNPSKHKRKNRYSAGTVEAIREPEVFAFKVRKDLYPVVKADLEERGISKQQLVDELLDCYYGESDDEELQVRVVDSPLIKDAIAIAIEIKQAAIRAEKKKKLSQRDQALIDKWLLEIEELSNYL